ncbi:MAG: hypothetical protein LQ346_001855 [Caloplaca aetnensis]|nr:MAG: hypothetical protein LQ346_001855 [Caloplaca aetnensis]
MSALTYTTIAAPLDNFRHYGKLAGVGYSQDMEIDHDLPRPAAPSDAMDTSLDRDLSDEHSRTATAEAQHALPAKPPVIQEPLPVIDHSGAIEVAAEAQGQMAHKAAKTPHFQQDLLALFGLKPLADTVARTDPNTGEKINKMRKSYEGKVKAFGLAGRNRMVKHNHEKSMGLLQMTQWPAEEWHNQKVHGRDVREGMSEDTMKKLDLAMRMQPGPVPNTAENDWEDLLGNERAKPLPTIDERPKKANRPDNVVKGNSQANGVRPATDTVPITDANRPKRTGKKRRYDDHSFEGYGEGFLDDDGEVIADPGDESSENGSRRGGAAKKRRKEYATTSPPTMGDRRGSYGIGMLGVGSGIGAYGR